MNQLSRTTRISVALLALLTATTAMADGLVLCFGSDGHVAIEAEHQDAGCPGVSASADSAESIESSQAGVCTDLPTGSAGELSISSSSAFQVSAPIHIAMFRQPEPRLVAIWPIGALNSDSSQAVSTVILRTTILLV